MNNSVELTGSFVGVLCLNNKNTMTTVKELLGQGDIKKPRKNFLQENIKRLKEMKLEKTKKSITTRTSIPSERQKKVQTEKTAKKQPSTDHSAPAPPSSHHTQGCQTLNGDELETLYQEGTIRYPSARCSATVALQTERQDIGDGLDNKTEVKDFVKINSTIQESQRVRMAEPLSTDPTRAPPNYQRGVVPRYLQDQKRELERERQAANEQAAQECPPGHVQLPDDIRLSHLTSLKKKYEDLVGQLNQLPVSVDTLRTRTRKRQIETDLDTVEAAITLFSREKVFVKADS